MRSKITLSNGQEVAIEVQARGERDVASSSWSSNFSDIIPAITGLSADLAAALEQAKPDKASVEFGLKLEFETSKLLAVLCSASANADLKIKLEWVSSAENGRALASSSSQAGSGSPK
ncbi:MAG: hypothetical protein K2Z25_18055 [Beijerinckiaceae bacterium]|nr:hypothetical protein [Beijerinckiaceae bacterium]